ncbi:MAG: phage coat protein [Peptoniphilus grossensis]|uniref:phage coat protein n=1 Tax=Peptoniphilus grossensis TaxID=1465756 RepID=UPI00290659EA|nr:phage coat protein [Peptoniphilus grossensis]MDU5099719.1 phage coat protein [Peptoniphilus grossensis]
MPAIFDAKYFNAEVFGKYVETIPKLKRNELLKSGAIVVNDRIKAMLSEQTGGNIVTTPMLGLIGGKPVNYDGKTDITDNSTKTYSHTRVVVGRANAWTEKDFSYDITGGVNFMDNVARQVAGYWDDIDQETLLAILEGIFAMTGTENKKFVDAHTLDLTKEKENNMFGVTTLNNALQQAVGENKQSFSLAIMHSQVATNLENLQLLEYLKYTDKNGVTRNLQMATVNGRTILIDDSMPVEEVTDAAGNYTAYTTYVLGKGAFELTNAGVKVPFEMDRNPKVNGGQDTLYSRQRNCFAPYGISFTNKKMASLSPTDEELKNGTNWSLVSASDGDTINHKAVPIARIITRG